MKIAIASDHAGFELKQYFVDLLKQSYPSIEVIDMGPDVYDKNDDYPEYIKKVTKYISENNDSKEYRGVIIGGSGQGENICANRYKDVRSVVVYGNDMDLNTDIVKLSRQHNDANVISFGARFINNENALELLKIWLEEKFTGEERHVRRLSKIENE